jgi:hypothetical protein
MMNCIEQAWRIPVSSHRMTNMKRNVLLLAACQAMFMTGGSLLIATSALVGYRLSPDKALATLPLAMQMLANMLTGIPASLLMQRVGRRAGFLLGSSIGIAGAGLAAYAIVTGLFTVLYLLLPNTRVKVMPALVGGLVAGLLWAATGKVFTTLVLASSQMKLVYAGFAIIAALFVWTYLGWLILLIGAQLAFYVQNPNYLRLGHAVLRLSSRELELLALDIMVHIGDALRAGFAPWSVDALSRKLGLPGIAVADMATNLERGGLLAQADDGTLFPARELTGIRLTQILDCARSDGSGHVPLTRAAAPCASRLQEELDKRRMEIGTLAQRLDVSENKLVGWAAEKDMVPIDKQREISLVLDIPVRQLFTDLPPTGRTA